MADIFIKRKALEEIEKLTDQYSETYSVSTIKENAFHYEITIEDGSSKIKVMIYFGKKGVKKVIQGDTKSDLYKTIAGESNEQKEVIDEPGIYIGSDETGKGDFFGPLVTAAVYVNDEIKSHLVKIGVRDSKQLSDTRIISIAKQIKELGSDFYEIISINPQKYNELYNRIKNINELLNWTHSKAIENLLIRYHAPTIITDKFRKKDLKFSKDFETDKFELIQVPKAEKYTAVAAASILAREKQLEWFRYNKINNHELPKGASDKVKVFGKKIVDQFGKDELHKFAKTHFKTTKSLF